MSQNDIIIRTHYKSPHRLHIDSDIPTPSSEPINQFARQLITLLDTSDLSSMLSYCVTQEFTANCRKISQNCYSTALFTIKEGANKQVISSQADSLIKISRIWA
ncbi:hypothetical protein V7O29_17855, partial [Escherichia coli]